MKLVAWTFILVTLAGAVLVPAILTGSWVAPLALWGGAVGVFAFAYLFVWCLFVVTGQRECARMMWPTRRKRGDWV
jgi:hypothetical protein